MLFSIYLAICAAATPVSECDRLTAVHWLIGPASEHPSQAHVGLAACMLAGQEYAAQSRLVAAGTYLKVYCRPVSQPAGVA